MCRHSTEGSVQTGVSGTENWNMKKIKSSQGKNLSLSYTCSLAVNWSFALVSHYKLKKTNRKQNKS